MKSKRKANPVLLFNLAYWGSFLFLYLPKFFFPNGFFLRSSLIWSLLLSTGLFTAYASHPLIALVYGTIATAILVSFLMMLTKDMKTKNRWFVLLVYFTLNTCLNILLSEG